MNQLRQPKGFTLIELVVVVVILGVLAVTAAPRFLNLQRDARIAAIQGLSGSIRDAAAFSYAKAAINGVEELDRINGPSHTSGHGETPLVPTNLGYLELKYGYPEVWPEDGGLGIIDLLDLGNNDWDVCFNDDDTKCPHFDYGSGSHNSHKVRFGFDIEDDPSKKCFVSYTEPSDDHQHYKIDIQTDDC